MGAAPRRGRLLALAAAALVAALARPAAADLDAAKKAFAEGVKSADWKARRTAYLTFSDTDSATAVRSIAAALATEPNPAAAAAAVDALGAMRSAESRAALIDVARKAKGAERLLAIVALEAQRGADVDAFLLEALAAGPGPASAQAALSLGVPGRAGAAAALEKALTHEAPAVRIAAMRSLVRLEDKAAVPALVERLKVERGRPREEAVRALEAITKRTLGDAPLRWAAVVAGADPAGVDEKPARPPTFFGIPVTGERVVFVLDRSLRMADPHPFTGPEHQARLEALCTPPDGPPIPFRELRTKMDLAVAQLLHAVDGLPAGAHVEVLPFASDVRAVFGRKWATVGAATRKTLEEALRGLEVTDGIAIWDALLAAFDLGAAGEERGRPTGADEVFLVTSNIPTKGEVLEPDAIAAGIALRARLRLAPVHVVGIGNHPFTLASGLARRTDGTYLDLSK